MPKKFRIRLARKICKSHLQTSKKDWLNTAPVWPAQGTGNSSASGYMLNPIKYKNVVWEKAVKE
jgi:hypothetical protein